MATVRHLSPRLLVAIVLLALLPAAAAHASSLSQLALSVSSTTTTSITVQVCAGATGAPAGYTIQWVTSAQLAANGGIWPSSGYGELIVNTPLAAGECTTVQIPGNLAPLTCGTGYAFKAWPNWVEGYCVCWVTYLNAATSACTGCTLTQGYWKTHPESWPVSSVTLGSRSYSEAEALAILNTPVKGNGLIALSYQLIAAKLNIAAGADGTAVAGAIAQADALIGNLVVPPIGNGYLPPAVTSALTDVLDSYNNGYTGPGHCS